MNVFALTRPCLLILVALSMQLLLPEAQGQLRVTNNLRLPIVRPLVPEVRVPDNWYPYVIARREDRDWIRSTPIELRPSRPMHVWGNTRRRILR